MSFTVTMIPSKMSRLATRKSESGTVWSNQGNCVSSDVETAGGIAPSGPNGGQMFSDYYYEVSTSETENSNIKSLKFKKLHDTIIRMQNLSEWEEMYLNREIGEKAMEALRVIEFYLGFEPPQIVNEGGEELSFLWSIGCLDRFITISDDEIGYMILDTRKHDGITDVITKGDEFNVIEFLSYFRSSIKSETLNMGKVNYGR